MTAAIDFYFDFISPFGYLGSTQIEAVAARHGRTVDWRPVLIGVTILKIMGMKPLPETPLKGPYLAVDAVRLAMLFGVPFHFHGLKGGNSLAAMRAFLWLKSRDPVLATGFAQRIYRRLWVEGREITSVDAVVEEAAAFGIAPEELRAALAQPAVKQALNDAVDAAVAEGVFGVPFFVVDGEKIWGSDRMWMIEHWLRHHSWSPAGSPAGSLGP